MLRRLLAAITTVLPLAGQVAPAAPTLAIGIVEGRVLGPLGEPMPNVEVTATYDARATAVLAKTRTDGEGMFVLGHLPTDRGCQILALAPGLTTSMGYASLGPTQPGDGVQLHLWDANTLRGRVVDEQGKPIADAAVLGAKDFTFFESDSFAPEQRTDAEGRFELRGVPIGDCVVRAWAPGFVMCEHRLFAVADATIEVQLVRGAGAGLAIAATGLPAALCAQTVVRIYPTRGGSGFPFPRCIERNVLDATGRLELAGLPLAEWNVELEAPGFTFEPRSVRTKEVTESALPLRFAATADGEVTLRGMLRSTEGKALANQELLCRTQKSQSMSGGRPGRATTDAQGRFVLLAPLVRNEPYSLHLVGSDWALMQAKQPDHTGSWDPRYLVRWEDKADPTRELALVAAPAASVTARLVDPDGKPVPFVWTELQGQRARGSPEWMAFTYATSTRDGVLKFPGVHGGDSDLRVHAAGSGGAGDSEAFRVAPGEHRSLTVVMERPGTVRGRVTRADGKPAPGVRVSLRNCDATTGAQTDGSWTVVPSDREGRFAFVGVSAGGHRIDIGLHGVDVNAISAPFAVAPGKVTSIDLQLPQ